MLCLVKDAEQRYLLCIAIAIDMRTKGTNFSKKFFSCVVDEAVRGTGEFTGK